MREQSRMPANRLSQTGGRPGAPDSEASFWAADRLGKAAWDRSYADHANSGNDAVNVRALLGVLRRRWMSVVGAAAALTAS